MNEILSRIRMLINEFGLSDSAFSKKSKIPQTTFANMFGRDSEPKADVLRKIIETYSVSANWLLTGEGEMFQKTEIAEKNKVKIPLLAQRCSCGPGQSWEQGDNIECYIEPLSLIPALKGKDIYAFKAKGISMLGVGIQNGDILFFDADKKETVSDGIYVFALFGDVFCKLLRFEKIEKKVMIYSVPNKELTEAELIRTITIENDDFHLLGRVLAWMHEDKLFQTF